MESGTIVYHATAGADKIVCKGPAYLMKVIIGKDVASSVVEVSDHISDGDGNVKVYLEGSTLMTSTKGEVEVNAEFINGICADLTNQTNVTFVYKPISMP